MSNPFSYYETLQDSKTDNLIQILGPSVYPSHFHRKIEITYLLRGTMSSRINDTDYFAETDDILFVPSYSAHSYATSENASRIVLCPHQAFTEDLDNQLGNRVFSSLLFANKTYNKTFLLPIFEELMKLSSKNNFLTILGTLDVFFGRLLEHYPTVPAVKSKLDVLANVLAYIDDHYTENLSLSFLAEKFGYNLYYFSKFFNAHVGNSFRNYLNGIRIRKFIENYHTSKENITHQAYNVGFNSMPSFYRAFNEVCRCSPKEYFG